MKLIKRSNIPSTFEEWQTYSETNHRMESKPSSFYLTNQSVNINCYSKGMKLQEQSAKNIEMGYAPIKPEILDFAKNIIRFEVQCKYYKTRNLAKAAQNTGNLQYNKYSTLLSWDNCDLIISQYYKKTIGAGHWYTIQEAIKLIKRQYFNRQKEQRLINALQLVNQCRNISKAKSAYNGEELISFKHTLEDLANLRINPVTIPKDWGIKYIPNLLFEYYNKLSDENSKKQMAEFLNELCNNAKSKKKQKKQKKIF